MEPWNKCNNESFHSFARTAIVRLERHGIEPFTQLCMQQMAVVLFGLGCTTLRPIIKSALIRDPPKREACLFLALSSGGFALCRPVALINHQQRTFPPSEHECVHSLFQYSRTRVFPSTSLQFEALFGWKLLIHQLRRLFSTMFPPKIKRHQSRSWACLVRRGKTSFFDSFFYCKLLFTQQFLFQTISQDGIFIFFCF